MKHTIKILSFFLACICLFCLLTGCSATDDSPSDDKPKKTKGPTPTPISRIGEEQLQYPAENDEFKYNVYETYVEIDEYIGEAENVIVPATIENFPVKVVGGFYFNDIIKTVTLPEGIIIIQNSAFDKCKKLESINIPESIIEIGDSAFYDCVSLKSLTIPKGVTKIGSRAFGICQGYSLVDSFVVKFYKGSAAAAYVADSAFDIQYEIIDK